MCFTSTHVCAPCACSVQKRAPDPLRLDLETILSNLVGAWNQTWVLCKSYKVLNNSASSPVLALELFTKWEIYHLYCLVIILKRLTLQGKGLCGKVIIIPVWCQALGSIDPCPRMDKYVMCPLPHILAIWPFVLTLFEHLFLSWLGV